MTTVNKNVNSTQTETQSQFFSNAVRSIPKSSFQEHDMPASIPNILTLTYTTSPNQSKRFLHIVAMATVIAFTCKKFKRW